MSKNITIGAWHITPSQNKVSLNTKDYALEPLAMDVLIYFAQNPNKVIGLEELIDNVWGGRIVGDHAIYRIINQIRNILSKDDNVSYITTIRKKGYQLNQPVQWLDSDEQTSEPLLSTVHSHTSESKWFKSNYGYFLLASPIIMLIAWTLISNLMQSISYKSIKTFDVVKPFSVLIGKEKDPSYSPNGQLISFSHRPKSGGGLQNLCAICGRRIAKTNHNTSW